MNLNLKALTDAEVNRQLDELDDAARSLSDGNLFKAQILGMRDELWAELARRDEANRAKEDAEQAAWDEAHRDDLMKAIFGENWNVANGAA